jgi:hypothetical protein
LEIRLDPCLGDLHTSVDLIVSLCWTGVGASEEAAFVVVDAETARADADQALVKGLVQFAAVPWKVNSVACAFG